MDAILLLADPAFIDPVQCLLHRATTFPTLGLLATCSRNICAIPTGQGKMTVSRKSAGGRSQIGLYGNVSQLSTPEPESIVVQPFSHVQALPDKGTGVDGRAQITCFPPGSNNLFSSAVLIAVWFRRTG